MKNFNGVVWSVDNYFKTNKIIHGGAGAVDSVVPSLFPHFNEKFPENLNWINVWAVKLSIYFENEEVGFDIFIIFLLLQIQGSARRRKNYFFKKGEQSAPWYISILFKQYAPSLLLFLWGLIMSVSLMKKTTKIH